MLQQRSLEQRLQAARGHEGVNPRSQLLACAPLESLDLPVAEAHAEAEGLGLELRARRQALLRQLPCHTARGFTRGSPSGLARGLYRSLHAVASSSLRPGSSSNAGSLLKRTLSSRPCSLANCAQPDHSQCGSLIVSGSPGGGFATGVSACSGLLPCRCLRCRTSTCLFHCNALGCRCLFHCSGLGCSASRHLFLCCSGLLPRHGRLWNLSCYLLLCRSLDCNTSAFFDSSFPSGTCNTRGVSQGGSLNRSPSATPLSQNFRDLVILTALIDALLMQLQRHHKCAWHHPVRGVIATRVTHTPEHLVAERRGP
mmetsp:Transcript_44840/g.138691  ORF Transcript_44840/g.138691 Transcript_44840/m.138691 type:complete len:312 (-) Transcript_44840:33-968(-)